MALPDIPCPRCGAALAPAALAPAPPEPCPGCRTPTAVEVFPALLRPSQRGPLPQTIVAEGEAGCFYHPEKRAAAHCQACGRFLCALCDVDLSGTHFCPACLEQRRRQGALHVFDSRRTLYDGAALTLAVAPLLIWPATLVTAPAAIGLALYGWRKPGSLVPRTRVRALLAILMGLLQMGGWAALVYFVVLGDA